MFVAERFQFSDELGLDAVNSHRDQLINGHLIVSLVLHRFYELGTGSVNAHSEEIIDRQMIVAERVELADKREANVVDGHREQLLVRELFVAQTFHFGREPLIRYKGETPGALSLFEPAFAIQRAGFSHDLKADG